MTPGDILIHRVAGQWCESSIVRVVRPSPGARWTLAIAQGMGVSQERLQPCDVVADGEGRWRLRRQETD